MADPTPDDTQVAGGGPGRTTIAPRVVERLAVAAAREVEETVSARDGLSGLVRGRLPRADAVVAGDTARIEVQVAATWPSPLPALAASVRDHVTHQVSTLADLDVTAVDVTVAAVVSQQSTSPRVL